MDNIPTKWQATAWLLRRGWRIAHDPHLNFGNDYVWFAKPALPARALYLRAFCAPDEWPEALRKAAEQICDFALADGYGAMSWERIKGEMRREQ